MREIYEKCVFLSLVLPIIRRLGFLAHLGPLYSLTKLMEKCEIVLFDL